MSPKFDVGMSADEVRAEAQHMTEKGQRAKKHITELMAELKSMDKSWWGVRAADAGAQANAAEQSMNLFYQEIERMAEILRANVAEFQKFDQSQ